MKSHEVTVHLGDFKIIYYICGMKKLIFILLGIVSNFGYVSAGNMPEQMRKYLDGCILMREAISEKSLDKLTDAKLVLKEVKTEDLSSARFKPADKESASHISAPTILFNSEFATELLKNGDITPEDYKKAHVMRKGDGRDLQTWHATIAPCSTSIFTTKLKNKGSMLLFSTLGAKLRLELTDCNGNRIDCESLDEDTTWFSGWELPVGSEDFTLTIINEGDTSASFVVAIGAGGL